MGIVVRSGQAAPRPATLTGAWLVLLTVAPVHATTYARSATAPKGLEVGIESVSLRPKEIIVSFVATNTTSQRLFIKDASFDDAQQAALDSGDVIQYPRIHGIAECRHDVVNCINLHGYDVSEYSAIDADKAMTFSLTYPIRRAEKTFRTLSFALSLIYRSDATTEVGSKPVLVLYNFDSVAVGP